MLCTIPFDIWEMIMSQMTFECAYKFFCLTKEFMHSISDLPFASIAFRDWGKGFWLRAMQRPSIASMPLETFRQELKRMHKFHKALGRVMLVSEYYNFWEADERVGRPARG